MNRQVFTKLLGAVFLALVVVTGAERASATPQAEQFVSKVAGKVLAAANNASTDQFRKVMRKYADVKTISRVAAGRHIRKMSAKEKHNLVRKVEAIIARGFDSHSKWLRGDSIKVTGSKTRGKRTIQVETRIVGGKVEEVTWKLMKSANGYVVVDINIAGIWLSSQVRSKLSLDGRNDVLAANSH